MNNYPIPKSFYFH